MTFSSRGAACVAALTMVLSTGLGAQVCDSGGAVALTINAQSPATVDPVGHAVPISVNGPLTLRLNDANLATPFILVIGSAIQCGAFVTPWGTIDLAGPAVLLDGFFGVTPFDVLAKTNFSVSVNVPCTAAGFSSPAFQGVHADPSGFPFPFDNTQAGVASYTAARTTVFTVVVDDSSFAYALLCPMTFGGVAYTQMFLGSNGFVTFRSGSNDFSPTPAEFHAGWQVAPTPVNGQRPGVAIMWADYFRGTAVTADNITVIETATTTEVQYNNMEWWNSLTPAGSFKCTFGALGTDSVLIDVGSVIPGVTASDQNPMIGVTDGDSNVGISTTVDISADLTAMGGTHVTPAGVGGESYCEQFPMAGTSLTQPLDLMTLSFIRVGGPFEWAIF